MVYPAFCLITHEKGSRFPQTDGQNFFLFVKLRQKLHEAHKIMLCSLVCFLVLELLLDHMEFTSQIVHTCISYAPEGS